MQSFHMHQGTRGHLRLVASTRRIPFGYAGFIANAQQETLSGFAWSHRFRDCSALHCLLHLGLRLRAWRKEREHGRLLSIGNREGRRRERQEKHGTAIRSVEGLLGLGQTCEQVFSATSSPACFRTKASMRAAEAAILASSTFWPRSTDSEIPPPHTNNLRHGPKSS